MTDPIRIGDQWYVAATSAHDEEQLQVLKYGDTFLLCNRTGDIAPAGGEQGLYRQDTRFLSQEALRIDGQRPLYLGSSVHEDNSLLTIDLMNPDLGAGASRIAKGNVHIFRAKLLWQDACYEHVRLNNHGEEAVRVRLSLAFDVDFIDLFEVRGSSRAKRGTRLAGVVGKNEVELPYRGLDQVLRRTRLRFDPAPSALEERRAEFEIELAPGAESHVYVTAICERESEPAPPPDDYCQALEKVTAARQAERARCCAIESSNPLVDLWLERSESDLAMLTTQLPTGPYPYAGVPWYSTTFGRDGILTARECLWWQPAMARGVLSFLAATQATEEDAERDAEPGKILHEARQSEMAATGEIPFGRYYGSVDSTPLFIGLAGAYYRRSGDLDFVRELWPHILRALKWIDDYGDLDGDGFVEYQRRSKTGLQQQGWKDSVDSIFHADGTLAKPPIALCEVQGYVYEAKLLAAGLARLVGDSALATRLDRDAAELQQHFEAAFWCEAIGSYALALDGDKRQCQVLASNAGHALWTGIADAQHAEQTTRQLLGSSLYNGFGIRTIGSGQARYNPMSYHDGSVWPHDNGLISAGMGRYGQTSAATRVLGGLFDASLAFDKHRLPELFCGFKRRESEGPTLYPVACSPQAWASAAVYALLQGTLGLQVDAPQLEVSLRAPRLPAFIDWLRLTRLAVGPYSVDLLLQRYQNDGVGVEVLRKDGPVEVRLTV
jgi:glycogen debranching enzyme